MSKVKWLELARRGKSQPLLWVDSFVELFGNGYMGRAHKIRWNPKNYRQFDGARGFGVKDAVEYQSILERAVFAKQNNLLTYGKEYESRIKEYRKFADKYKSEDFSKLTNHRLAQIFTQWFEHTKRVWSFAWDYIFLNRFLPDIVTSAVASKVPDIGEQTRILGTLFLADRPSELFLDKKDLLNVAAEMRRQHLKLSDRQVQKSLLAHLYRFAHLGFYYFRGAAYTIEDLQSRLKEYLKLPSSKFIQLQKDIAEQERNRKGTQEIIKKLALNAGIIWRIKCIKRWASLSTQVDETYGYVVHNLHGLWQEISDRLGLTYRQFYSLTAKEIHAALIRPQNAKVLKKTAQFRHDTGAVLVLENGKKIVLHDKELERYIRQEAMEKKKVSNVRELKGQAASVGQAKGRVRLVFSVHDVPKVEKGDIMVAPSTNPTFVPAMERAKAIITDEGGLLSHAAIVSRELKIPCVVGTKIATQVFKDGDMVEVNANHGWVRKLTG